MKRQIEY